jgi:hypothetical protein
VVIEVDHHTLNTPEVLGSGVVVETHTIANIEHRQRLGGADRLKQLLAGIDRVADCGQMLVQHASGDLVEQQPRRRRW